VGLLLAYLDPGNPDKGGFPWVLVVVAVAIAITAVAIFIAWRAKGPDA